MRAAGRLRRTTQSVASSLFFSHGLWLDRATVLTLPTTGTYWTTLKAAADATWPLVTEMNEVGGDFEQYTLAGALVYGRLKGTIADATADPYRVKVRDAINAFNGMTLNPTASVLCYARNLGALCIAADIINLGSYDSTVDTAFRTKMTDTLNFFKNNGGMTTVAAGVTGEPDNRGVMCRFSATCVWLYKNDTTAITNNLLPALKRYLGDTTQNGNNYSWHANTPQWQITPSDSTTFVGICPAGATKDGHDFDGLKPEDQRRHTDTVYNSATYPNVADTDYWRSVIGTLAANVILLERAGYTGARLWSNSAVKRSYTWTKPMADAYTAKGYAFFPGDDNDCWVPTLLNYLYGLSATTYPESNPATTFDNYGDAIGWTHWSHKGRGFA